MLKKIVPFIMSFVIGFGISSCVYASPSNWAINDVNTAKELGIYNSIFENNFQQPITRAEFCSLAVKTIEKWNDDLQISNKDLQFVDTDDADVLECAKLGIVSGVGNGKFEPNSPITREQAAKMLYNTINNTTSFIDNYKGNNDINNLFLPHIFDDSSKIHNWARNEIYAVYHLGVMYGTNSDDFSPLDSYTREQAVCTFLRLYNTYNNPQNANNNIELYPDINTAFDIRSNNSNYYLDASYKWGTDSYNYEPKYYDALGNTYTSNEKGYVYPQNKKAMEVVTISGAEVAESVVIDSKGNEILKNIDNVIDINDNYVVYMSKDDYKCHIFDINNNKEIAEYSSAYSVGCNMYAVQKSDSQYIGYTNSNFKEIIPCVYQNIHSKFYNNLTVLQKQDDSFIIVDNTGNIVKNFKLNLQKYSVNSVYGTNMILTDNISQKYVLYRAYSEKYGQEYDNISFTSNGDMIAYNSGKYYLLGKSGQVVFDANSKGYDYISEIDETNCYCVGDFNKNDWSKTTPYDIIDSNGNVIYKNVPTFDKMAVDNGIIAYAYNNSIVCFDTYGKDIGSINTNNTINSIKFINGLIYANISSNNTNTLKVYMPTGEEISILEK